MKPEHGKFREPGPLAGISSKGSATAKAKPEVYIYDEIGPAWLGMRDAAAVIADLDALGAAKEFVVRINSPGGDVFEGIAIYNAMKRHSARVTVEVDGLAASIASVIAMAGDGIRMSPGSMFMVHNAWTMSLGNAQTHREAADVLDKIDESLVGIYSDRGNIDTSTIRSLMAEETWMTAEQAVSMGFADSMISDGLSIAACTIPLQFGFRHVPKSLQDRIERRTYSKRKGRGFPERSQQQYPQLAAVQRVKNQRRAV